MFSETGMTKPHLKRESIFKADVIGKDKNAMHIHHAIGFDSSVRKTCELFFNSGKGAAYSTKTGAHTDHSFNFTYGIRELTIFA